MTENKLSYAEAWSAFMQSFSTMEETLGAVAQAENTLAELQAAIVKTRADYEEANVRTASAEATYNGSMDAAKSIIEKAKADAAATIAGAEQKASDIIAAAKLEASDLDIQGRAALGIATLKVQDMEAKYALIKADADEAIKQMNDARSYLAALKGA
jgi:cell division septum initiation protein DivIVA